MPEMDEATGLPQIAENLRWRIGPSQIYTPGFGYHSHSTELSVFIEKKSEYTEMHKPRRLWGLLPAVVSKAFRWNAIAAGSIKGNNPIGVRNAANAALKAMAVIEAREKLIGVYPPLKLGE